MPQTGNALLPPGPRRAAIALWCIGVAFAGSTAVLAVAHGEFGFAALYAAVAAGLAALARITTRPRRRAEIVTLILLGSQIVGAAGAAWELASGDDDNAKARHLHDLGVNYRLALALNFGFSVAASAVFVWALVARRRRPG
jgi:hypothetical protein